MKKIFYFFLCIAITIVAFTSCEENTNEKNEAQAIVTKGCYIVNYGSFSHGGSSVSRFDYDADIIYNDYNKTQNFNKGFLSNIQFAGLYNNELYFMGNSPDQVFSVNKYMVQSQEGSSNGIEVPRAFVGAGNYLYISCWGTNYDYNNSVPGSYIAKFNIITRSVEKIIALPGGPEGLEIVNGKLYAALNYKDSVAVVNLTTEAISYIETPSVCSYFIKDKSDNLYVSLVSTPTDYSANTGLGYINTTTDVLSTTYAESGISSDYGAIMASNSDLSKIYICTGGWVEIDGKWVNKGAVSVFNVNSKTFTPLFDNISGLKGLVVNPINNDLYVMISNGASIPGTLKIYNSTGVFKKQFDVGLTPAFAFFLD